VLWGFAWSGIWIGGNSVILDISQAEARGNFSGRYQTWFFIGVGGSALLAGVFTDMFGFRGGLFLSAALNAIALLLWLYLLPETKAPTIQILDGAASNGVIDWSTVWHAALPIFGMRFVYAGVIASSSILWIASLFQSSSALSNLALPLATATGIFVALRTITSMLSGPISGEISDRLGRRWGVIAGLLILGSLGTWLMGYRNVTLAIFGGFVAAIPGGGLQALIPALIGDRIDPAWGSRSLGVVYTFGDLGSALGPVVALGLIDKIGLPSIYRLCSLLLIVLAIISSLRSRAEPDRIASSHS
jgi:MFS family permease